MEIILLERIANLGSLGEKVSVKAGYARNFLIPKGKAKPATEANLAEFEARRAELEKQEAETLSAANQRKEKIEAVGAITIEGNAGTEGKLFGSIGTQDIIDALQQQGVEVERKEIKMPEGNLREIGEYDIAVQLHSDVVANFQLVIKSDNTDDE